MIDQINNSQLPFRAVGAGLGRLALVLGAAWALSGAVPTPAKALDTTWREACTYKAAPQGYGDMAKERSCIVKNYCQDRADAQGSPYTGNGCIMVPPMAVAAPATPPRATYTKR
jgi:hypothetical protein